MLLLVSPLSYVPGLLTTYRPSHVVSLLSPAYMHCAPADQPKTKHLRLGLHDIAEPQDDMIAPDEAHLAELFHFARGWEAKRPLLVHCWAGVSRSMAAAYAILCDRAGRGAEKRLAKEMRVRAPHAFPNRRMVRLADKFLHRDGAMMLAVEEMGPPTLVEEGIPVIFPLEEVL